MIAFGQKLKHTNNNMTVVYQAVGDQIIGLQ